MSLLDESQPVGRSFTERRAHGRTDALQGLSRLLESVRRRGAWHAVALADGAGCLIAGGGLVSECEELAAYAPLLDQTSPANDVVPPSLDVLSEAIIRRICVDGVEILLCARGAAGGQLETLADAERGARRILGRRRPGVE